jgi:hypothetical protein
VLSDPPLGDIIKPIAEYVRIPLANFIPDADAYGETLSEASFADISVGDVTGACVGGFCRHLASWSRSERR